jgi:hypothetical protein
MSYKPVPTKKFKKFLKNHDLELKRTEGDHEIWDKADDSLLRPVTIIGCDKEVPALHIKTTLKNMGIDPSDFENEISKL